MVEARPAALAVGALALVVIVLAPARAPPPRPARARRVASSYCTNNACPAARIAANASALNSFSAETYDLTASGALEQCSANDTVCTWDGSPADFNRAAQAASGATADPLVFSNGQWMIAGWRALVATPATRAAAIEYLVAQARAHGYGRVQFDLEPSCWAAAAADCGWPDAGDARDYASFLRDARAALARGGTRLAVAAAGFPPTQCSGGFAEAAACAAGAGAYPAACESGAWGVDACNCCAYTTWFNASALCAPGVVDTVVNMDTYLHAPLNGSLFDAAMRYYADAGCAPEDGRLAVGLLAAEAANASEAAAVMARVEAWQAREVDFWVNMWQNAAALDAWAPALRAFLALR